MTTSPEPPQPRKAPRQARSRASVEAIVEAAARILEERGAGALTTNAVAERAGVGIGTLYQYFPDKRAVVAEIVRRERQRLLEDVRAARAASESTGADPLPGLIAAALAHQFGRARLGRELEHLERGLHLDDEAEALARTLANDVRQALVPTHPHATLADARDCVAVVRALADAAAMDGEEDAAAVEQRAEQAVRGLLGRVRKGGPV